MIEQLTRYNEQLRWLAEFSLLPAHLLAVAHWYGPAVCVGCLALLAHAAVAITHVRSNQPAVVA